MSTDGSPDQRAKLIAAASAAASWARARRATWTDAPLAVPPPTPHPPAEISPTPAAEPSPLPPVPIAIEPAGPSIVARAANQARAAGAAVARRVPLVAAAAALLALGVAGGVYVWRAGTTPQTPVAAVEPAPIPSSPSPPVATRRAMGGLRLSSTPAGAEVFVDGKARGVTPLTLTDLIVGRHAIELKSAAGTVQRTVTVVADKTSEVDVPIFSGWVALYSPFDVVVSEGGRALRLDDRNQIMVPPGRHSLRLVNRALAYDAVHEAEVRPGETTTVTIAVPSSTMTVTASEPAEVWLDGQLIGEAPLNARPVTVGSHDIVVKRASGGERRFTVTVTMDPFTLNVDFSKPEV